MVLTMTTYIVYIPFYKMKPLFKKTFLPIFQVSFHHYQIEEYNLFIDWTRKTN